MRFRRSLAALSAAAVLVAAFVALSSAPAQRDPGVVDGSDFALAAAQQGSGGLLGDWLDAIRDALQKAADQAAAAQRPAQVSGVKATPGDTRIDLTWSAPSSRQAITSYTVGYTSNGGKASSTTVSTTKAVLNGLVNGTSYVITVAAISAGGTGPVSSAITATPMAPTVAPSVVPVVPVVPVVVNPTPTPPVASAPTTTPASTSGASASPTPTATSGPATTSGSGATWEPTPSPSSTQASTLAPTPTLPPTETPSATPSSDPTATSGPKPSASPTLPSSVATPTSTPTLAPTSTPSPNSPNSPTSSSDPDPTPTGPHSAAPETTIVAAGFNGNAQLLTGTTDQTSHPTALAGTGTGNPLTGQRIDQVSVGEFATCAVSDAKAYCWGANPDGQLGNGTTTNSALPIEVGGVLAGKTVTDIEAGIHQTCAVADGSAYCWGNNGSGQLGNGTTVNSLVPVAVSTGGALSGRTVQSISTQRGHTCALADGQAFCWGDNQWGQLGNGTTTNSTVPVAVSTTGVFKDKTVTALSSGFFQSCAIADEKAYCWGYNGYGALGNNSTSNSSIPVAVYQSADGLAGQPVTDIDSRSYSSCAVAGGKAYCWGYNNYGPLGNDATNNRQVPIAVYADSGPLAGKTITRVRTGYVENGPYAATGCAISSDGSAACWGTTNTYGNLADGTSSGSKTPVAVDVRGGLSGTAAVAVATNGRTTMFLN